MIAEPTLRPPVEAKVLDATCRTMRLSRGIGEGESFSSVAGERRPAAGPTFRPGSYSYAPKSGPSCPDSPYGTVSAAAPTARLSSALTRWDDAAH